MLLERLHELPKGAWIALVIAGFWLWWPMGLAALGYLAFGRRAVGRWYNAPPQPAGGVWNQAWGGCRSRRAAAAPSGNRAFDEYRAETLKRLEEEQQEFVAYLERLRQARDKAEFDAFMAERRPRSAPVADVE